MNRNRLLLALASAMLAAPLAHAQDAQRGMLLYQTHCNDCHYERVFERPPSRSLVKSLAALQSQVERWSAQTKYPFTPEDIRNVIEYLNRTHYKFEK